MIRLQKKDAGEYPSPCILYFFEKICFKNTYMTIPKAIR